MSDTPLADGDCVHVQCSENERRAPMHRRLAEVIGERERRIAAARAEAEASGEAQLTFRPRLDGRSLRLAAGHEAERAAAGGVARPKEASGGLSTFDAWLASLS